jgi:hypothetical protein
LSSWPKKNKQISMKTLILFAVLISAPFAFADGKLNLNFEPNFGVAQFTMDANHVGNTVTGSVSPSKLTQFIQLQNNGAFAWQGSISSQIASTELQTNNNGSSTITISTLPGGFYTYTWSTKANGDIEINGMGPNGNLNSAGLEKSGNELYFQNMSYSYDVTVGSDGSYSGSVQDGGSAYLEGTGDLNPKALAAADPVLFILLYVLPFSN